MHLGTWEMKVRERARAAAVSGQKWHVAQSDWELGEVKGLLECVLAKQVTPDCRGQENQLPKSTDCKHSR